MMIFFESPKRCEGSSKGFSTPGFSALGSRPGTTKSPCVHVSFVTHVQTPSLTSKPCLLSLLKMCSLLATFFRFLSQGGFCRADGIEAAPFVEGTGRTFVSASNHMLTRQGLFAQETLCLFFVSVCLASNQYSSKISILQLCEWETSLLSVSWWGLVKMVLNIAEPSIWPTFLSTLKGNKCKEEDGSLLLLCK